MQTGTPAPSVTLISTGLEKVNLAEYAQGSPTVLLFFPAAFTSVCTKELCTFRDSLATYEGLGARVVGISVDTPWTLKVFAEQQGITFPMMSDFNKEAIRAFDVIWPDLRGLHEVARRAAFVLDSQGLVRWAWIGEHPGLEPPYEEVVAAVKAVA